MPSAARREVADESGPDMAAVAAKAGSVLDAMMAATGRITDTLNAWGTACPQDSRAVPYLQSMSAEVIGAGLHCEELRQEVAKLAAGLGSLEQAFAAGRALERSQAQQASPSAPGRHAKPFKLLKGGSVAAFAGAAFTGLRHAWAAHPAATAAAGLTTVATLTAATAVVAPHAAATFGVGGSPSVPNPAASIYSAVPVTGPSSQKLIAAVTGRKGSSRTLTVSLPPSLPSYAPQDAPSAPVQNPGQPSSAPVTIQGTLTVSTSALDLSGSGVGSFTLSCSGGPCDWHVVPGSNVGADTRQGTLQDGQSVTVGLSIDPAALLLGGSATVRIWPGDITVAVTWLAPVVPSVVPSVLPTDLPTVAGT